jgi:hypothetical protein
VITTDRVTRSALAVSYTVSGSVVENRPLSESAREGV